MQQLVSIIIPIYNVESYLKRCIESVINQTYKNLEIILVNDGSTDNCGTICDKYKNKDNRIKVIHKKNGGLSDARNAGIEIATGKYLTFIDSDDYVSIDYIEYMINMLEEKKAQLAICKVKEVWPNSKLKDEAYTKIQVLNSKQTFENLLLDKGIEVSSYAKLYSIDLFKKLRFPKGKVYEDTAIIYKIIANANRIVYGDKYCYYYISREGSISKHKEFNSSEIDYIEHTEQMLNFIRKRYKNLKIPVYRYYVYYKFRILKMLVFTKPRNKKMEKQIIEDIKKYQKIVFKYKETPKKDKIAIILLNLGLPIFKFSWILYRKVTGRI